MDVRNTQVMYCGNVIAPIDEAREVRFTRLRHLMAVAGVQALWMLGCGVDGVSEWLTGVRGPEAPGFADGSFLILPDGDIIQIGSNHVADEAYRQNRVVLDEMPMPSFEVKHIAHAAALERGMLAACLSESPVLGVTHPELMTERARQYLEACFPGIQFLDLTRAVRSEIAKKTASDIAFMRISANVHDRVFSRLQTLIRPGRTERDVAIGIRMAFYDFYSGGQDIVHTVGLTLTSGADQGVREQEPVLYPGRILREGDRVNVLAQGHCMNFWYAALGRSYVLGTPDEQTYADWEIAVQAQRAAAEALKPGITIRQAAEAANHVLVEAGLPEDTGRFIYGIGLSVGEHPQLGDASASEPLEEGMTLVIAPKVQRPSRDPLICADTFLVTSNGLERLTQTAQELFVLSTI